MPSYQGKPYTKTGRGAQSKEQLSKFTELLLEKDDAPQLTLQKTGDPLIVVFESEPKAYSIKPNGDVTRVNKPKVEVEEPEAEKETATA